MSAVQFDTAEGSRRNSTSAWRATAGLCAIGLLLSFFVALMIAGAGEIGWRPVEGAILVTASPVAAWLSLAAFRRNARYPQPS